MLKILSILWHENFLTGNHDFLDEILDESVVFHSPVVFKPLPGKDMTKMYLIAALNRSFI